MPRVVDVPFVKGHGTCNDFVILPDLDGGMELSAQQVRWVCDRRAGIGADGVLRVVRTAHEPEFAQYADIAEFFMDYRNADGSLALMCGNGARVFVRYLHATGELTSRSTVIATRGGLVEASIEDGQVTVGMGAPVDGSPRLVSVSQGGRAWEGAAVHVPNPHAVVFVEAVSDLGALSPTVTPVEAFPDGVNVEFVERLAPGHIAMRVHERGIGETSSCGTGACAAAWATSRTEPSVDSYRVDVPGGTVWVDILEDGRVQLRGPAELVARGTFQWPRGL